VAADDLLDELYAAPPAEFVARREALVKQLRAAGDTERAAAVHQLRRPSVVAWSVNQVARGRGRDVAALVGAGDELRAAIASGDGDAIRAAMRARRARVELLTDAAVEQAAALTSSPEAHRDAIAATFEAATADDDARELVVAGRLSTELRPSSTALDDLVALTPAAPRSRGSGARLPRSRGAALPRDELALRRAEEAVAAARRELAETADTLKEAEAEVTRAERAARAARDAHRRAEGRLERAQRTLQERRSR
jgi:chromosome segregation ATPase